MHKLISNPIVTVVIGVVAAAYLLNFAYTNNVPVLADAAKAFK